MQVARKITNRFDTILVVILAWQLMFQFSKFSVQCSNCNMNESSDSIITIVVDEPCSEDDEYCVIWSEQSTTLLPTDEKPFQSNFPQKNPFSIFKSSVAVEKSYECIDYDDYEFLIGSSDSDDGIQVISAGSSKTQSAVQSIEVISSDSSENQSIDVISAGSSKTQSAVQSIPCFSYGGSELSGCPQSNYSYNSSQSEQRVDNYLTEMLFDQKDAKILDKEICCKICNKLLITASTNSQFDLIKCPTNEGHLFHLKCFVSIVKNPVRCPVCSSNCTSNFSLFSNTLLNSLQKEQDIVHKINSLNLLSKSSEDYSFLLHFDNGNFSLREIENIIYNLEPHLSVNPSIRKFHYLLDACCKRPEIFSITKDELFQKIMSGVYNGDSEAFYPILFNCNREFFDEIDNKQFCELLISYCILNKEMEPVHRMEFVDMMLARISSLGRSLDSECIYDLLSATIDSTWTIFVKYFTQNASSHSHITVEMFCKLVQKVMSTPLNSTDKTSFLKESYAYLKVNSGNVMKIIENFSYESKNTAILEFLLKTFRFGHDVVFNKKEIIKIITVLILNGKQLDVLHFLVRTSILSLPINEFEELLKYSERIHSFNLIEVCVSCWPVTDIPNSDKLMEILSIPMINEGENFSTLIYAMFQRELINVETYIGLIQYYQKANPSRVTELICEFYPKIREKFNKQDFDRLIEVCREVDSIELLAFFLTSLEEGQVLRLSTDESSKIIKSFHSLCLQQNSMVSIEKFVASPFFFVNFNSTVMIAIDLTSPIFYDKLFAQIVNSPHFKTYLSETEEFRDFIFTALENDSKSKILKAFFSKLNTVDQIITKFYIIGWLINETIPHHHIRTETGLEKILKNYNFDQYFDLSIKDIKTLLNLIESVDNDEMFKLLETIP